MAPCLLALHIVQVQVVLGFEESAGGASDLLAALANMTRLRRLELHEIDLPRRSPTGGTLCAV
jgi:hypothetical protein